MITNDKPSNQQIAEAFSNGNFKLAYPFFAEKIEWHIIGENSFIGKKSVIENCEQTSAYFKSVTTEFTTFNVLVDSNRIAINGNAVFTRNDERLSNISACDVYEFNDDNELQIINSYCITNKLD
ncbi:nuclear transport factor 2 family protein [Geomicrobium sp. JCM 19039]|uniref:nuclear transport factor 2 family protein n=1 Tax=Geomicrobium sp. JCM 19039 TaxID=1460636 RepID=UPI0005A7DBA3|nr:hypothetical protein [Geomicrobium sp. JCM 19039]